MSLIQKPLNFRERKNSKSSTSKFNEDKNERSSPCPQRRVSAQSLSNKESISSKNVAQVQPLTPSKRRNKNQTEPHSPPKIKCEDESAQPTPPATPSVKFNAASGSPRQVTVSPKTPSSYISQLTLESPSILSKDKQRPPKSLFSEPEDLLSKARNALHTHSVTDLPGREEELEKLNNFIYQHLENGTSGSLYISGPPGTGKTACLTHVIEQPDLKKKCKVVSINCTAVGSPNIVYSKLFDELKLKKSGNSPLEAITKYLQRNHKTILIVFDEMDQLGTRNQSVLYSVFEWPATYSKGIIIIGIANALDLTDRMLPRLKAKLKLTPQLLHFSPYSREQLLGILQSRLKESGATSLFVPSALQLLASKQAAVNGDARRALDTARRLVENVGCKLFQKELVEDSALNASSQSDIHPMKKSDGLDSPQKCLRSSPRKPMTPVCALAQVPDKLDVPLFCTRSPNKYPQSPLRNSIKSPLKENASPSKSKSARKLDFFSNKNSKSDEDLKKSEYPSITAPSQNIDVKSVMAAYSGVYGTSQNLGRSADGSGEELPIQHKLAICSLLLILRKGKNKDVTLGKHHDVYRKVCAKRQIAPLDQGEFLSMLELIEARGIVLLQSRGKAGAGRLIRVCFQWVEDEVVSALQDRDLLASIINDVACLC